MPGVNFIAEDDQILVSILRNDLNVSSKLWSRIVHDILTLGNRLKALAQGFTYEVDLLMSWVTFAAGDMR